MSRSNNAMMFPRYGVSKIAVLGCRPIIQDSLHVNPNKAGSYPLNSPKPIPSLHWSF